MELFPRKKLSNDVDSLKEARAVISSSYQDFGNKHPNLLKLFRAILVIVKWLLVFAVISITVFLFYRTFIDTHSEELPKLPNLQDIYIQGSSKRIECLHKLGIPDRGQILLPSECN